MARILILDSDPTGLACHDSGMAEASSFRLWLFDQMTTSALVVVPAIVDYEVRRSLILAGAVNSLSRLDDLYASGWIRLLPVTNPTLRRAAALWAEARRQGQQTASDGDIDGDVILAAQAIEFCTDADDWTILTENVAHIARYVGDRARSRRFAVADWLRGTFARP